jgi:hypothetical protein
LGALRPSLVDRQENFRNCIRAWFGAEISFAVDADANGIGFDIAFSVIQESAAESILLSALTVG